jgi:hypothetical protein
LDDTAAENSEDAALIRLMQSGLDAASATISRRTSCERPIEPMPRSSRARF